MDSEWSQSVEMFLSHVNANQRAKAAEETLLWICQPLSPASCSKTHEQNGHDGRNVGYA